MINYLKYKIKNFLNFNKRQLGEIQLLLKKKDYLKITNIRDAELKVFSQNGEDGIIDFLLFKIKKKNAVTFIEIGVEDYEESNTRFLVETRPCTGLLIDINTQINFIKKRNFYWKNDLHICTKKINPENICEILDEYDFAKKSDIFSIDIDGLDYWVLKAANLSKISIVVAEYNPLFGSKYPITIPYLKNFERDPKKKSYFGMSINASIDLMKSKGFFFVGANTTCCNAFFINNKYKENFENLEINNLDEYIDFKFRENKSDLYAENKVSFLKDGISEQYVFFLPSNDLKKIKDINL
jgi:hypothetical protein